MDSGAQYICCSAFNFEKYAQEVLLNACND